MRSTSRASAEPGVRVSTTVPGVEPRNPSLARSASGVTETPRFLIVNGPMSRARSAARSCFSWKGSTSSTSYVLAKGVGTSWSDET